MKDYGIRLLGSDERAGVELTCAADGCDETFVSGVDDATVERERADGRRVWVSTSDSLVEKVACCADHAETYRDEIRQRDDASLTDGDGTREINS